MKFFIINNDYQNFINWFYENNNKNLDYEAQYNNRMQTFFATNDFYSYNLKQLGHEAWDIIANAEWMQKSWAASNSIKYKSSEIKFIFKKKIIPWLYLKKSWEAWYYPILIGQIKKYKPDVIYSMAMETIGDDFLRSVRGFYKIAIGQHAATPIKQSISEYDLVISSLPNQVEFFRTQGLKSEFLSLGFEPRILDKLVSQSKKNEITFVGGLGKIYSDGNKLLESISNTGKLKIWSFDRAIAMQNTNIKNYYYGELWGIDMFQCLMDSKIILNRHSNLADKEYANNMRLFEATGVGSLLLTDNKKNISNLFDVGKEIIVYNSPGECLELIDFYLKNDTERQKIALAGQNRTLSEHTWLQKMGELVDIIQKISEG